LVLDARLLKNGNCRDPLLAACKQTAASALSAMSIKRNVCVVARPATAARRPPSQNAVTNQDLFLPPFV
jgi:hypothetical protein